MPMEKSDAQLSQQARGVLGLAPGDGAAALRAAFHRAVKAAHPDRPGGDAARLREVVAAYRLLKSQETSTDAERIEPPTRPPAAGLAPTPFPDRTLQGPEEPALEIGPLLALLGGQVTADLGDRTGVPITLPPGLRAGDRLMVEGEWMTIRVKRDAELTLRGDDLWLSSTLPTDAAQGGRVEISAPGGSVRRLWVGRRALAQGLLKIEGAGLPARGDHQAGDLFVTLQPAAPTESVVRRRLKAFEETWAPRP